MLLSLPAIDAADDLVLAAVIHRRCCMYIAVAATVMEVVQMEAVVAATAEY